MAKTKYLVSKSGDAYLNCKQLRARTNAKGEPTFKPAPHLDETHVEEDFETVEAEAPKPKKKVTRKKKAPKKAEAAPAPKEADAVDLDDWD